MTIHDVRPRAARLCRAISVVCAVSTALALRLNAQRVSPASLEARAVPRADTSVTLHVGGRDAGARDLVAELRVPKGAGPHPIAIVIHGGCWVTRFADARYIRPLAMANALQRFNRCLPCQSLFICAD